MTLVLTLVLTLTLVLMLVPVLIVVLTQVLVLVLVLNLVLTLILVLVLVLNLVLVLVLRLTLVLVLVLNLTLVLIISLTLVLVLILVLTLTLVLVLIPPRQCATNQYLRKRGDPHRYCQDACANVTRCGPVVVPQHHLQVSGATTWKRTCSLFWMMVGYFKAGEFAAVKLACVSISALAY